MCIEIYLPDQKRRIARIGDLRHLIYPAKVEIRDGYGALSGDSCLCPVDIAATAAAAGYVNESDPDGNTMSLRWRKAQ